MYKNKETQILQKGLVLDTAKSNQPKDSYSYALNAVNETKEGEVGYLSNEPGNSLCSSFVINGTTYHPIGHVNLLDNEVLLFLATESGLNSCIAIYKGSCIDLQVVVEVSCLNFSIYHQIKATYRVRKGCNRTIYFCDYFNPDRVIDIDEILNNPTSNRYIDNNGNFDCTLTKISPDFNVPYIQYDQTNDAGGNLRLGTYEFALALGDEDLNFTAWQGLTNPIPIVSGSLSGDYNKIEGGDPTLTPTINTGKSINLTFKNLDSRYNFVKLAVIETIGGVTTAYSVDTFGIAGIDFSYTYSGLDYNSATTIPLTEIAVNTIVYDTSYTIEQQDNRLIRGNIKEKNTDYTAFQRAANSITSRYVTKPIKYKTDQSVQSGNYYFDNRSYMRDEIYALGIKGVWMDGSETPIFHISGRALDIDWNSNPLPTNYDPDVAANRHNRKYPLTGWDSTVYPIANSDIIYSNTASSTQVSIEDVRHLSLSIGDNVERWKVFNTATRTELNTLQDQYYSKGQLAYFESSYTYPSTLDCNGTRIYPLGNIRHHKMPDTTLEQHHVNDGTDDYILSLGLEFNLVSFNALLQASLGSTYSNLQGFKIVRAKRDKGNKTIIDKGIAFNNIEAYLDISPTTQVPLSWQTNVFNRSGNVDRSAHNIALLPDGTGFNTNDNTFPQVKAFGVNEGDVTNPNIRFSYSDMTIHSPKNKFNPTQLNGQYIKMEKELWGNYECYGDTTSWRFNQSTPSDNSRASWMCNYRNYSPLVGYKGTPATNFTNRLLQYKYNIGVAQNLGTIPRKTINKFSLEGYSVFTQDHFPSLHSDSLIYGGSPADYLKAQDGIPGPDEIATGYYVSVKDYKSGIYNQLHNIIYQDISNILIPTTTTNIVEFSGDIFISMLAFRKTFLDEKYYESGPDEHNVTVWQNLVTYFVESEINCKLRHRLTTDETNFANTYYPFHGEGLVEKEDMIFGNDQQASGGTDLQSVIDLFIDGKMVVGPFNYNKDYSKEISEKPSFPLPIGFDYCSQCINKFPHRLVYSVKSYQEDQTDNYLKFLANNYRDLQGNTGEITDLFRKQDELYIRTKYSLWALQTKPQEMKTNTGNVYISTGEFFEVPPKELVSNKTGYAGGQTRWDLVVNEYGATFVDQSLGMIFNFNEQLGEISDSGIRHWLEQNLASELLNFDSSFPYFDNPASNIGIGLVGCYDPVKRRYILTKKDYKPIFPLTTTFNSNLNRWEIVITPILTIIVTDPYNAPTYFENKSWTLSYSFETKTWVSYHSYTPNYTFYNRDTFFTSIYDSSNTWVHGEGEFQSFYGTVFPHIFEYIVNENPIQTKTYDNTKYIGNVTLFDNTIEDYVEIEDKTFNKALFYNDSQTTGILDVIVKNNIDPFSSIIYDPATIEVENVESTWNFNGMRDMTKQTNPKQPLFVKNWTSIQGQYPIDKIPNINVISYLKSQFEIERMRDNYMATRLFFTDPQNHKIITKYITTSTKVSLR